MNSKPSLTINRNEKVLPSSAAVILKVGLATFVALNVMPTGVTQSYVSGSFSGSDDPVPSRL